MQRLDLIGHAYGLLIVLSDIPGGGGPLRKVLCRCGCGVTKAFFVGNLRRGVTTSCGCEKLRLLSERRTHGASKTQAHKAWLSMKNRCSNPRNRSYANYGGRGICVCDRWRHSFEAFIADIGQRPTRQHQLDRINNDGHYDAGNVRWAIPKQQQNNRRDNHRLTHNGVTRTLQEWANDVGIDRRTIAARLQRGYSVADALTAPVQRRPIK